ncbi:MAG: leucine-rich repeat protein [Ruminococcus sp.]|nr:leucine-rich repeat protein [Ruminococcus sp.]
MGGMYASADTPADAKDELTDGTFTYELVDGSYTIISCDTTAIITDIPELRNGYAITAIADKAFVGCNFISEINIPKTVKSIGVNSFSGCSNLKKVKLSEKMNSISEGAFMSCPALEEIEIPDSITSIGNYAFYGCTSLKEITLPESLSELGTMAFAECGEIEKIDASKCDGYVFENDILYDKDKKKIFRASAKLAGETVIENTVESIEPGAFSMCGELERVYIPQSVTYIGEDAFGYCAKLKKADLSEGLNTIAPIAFKYCYALEAADIPTTVTEIGEGAFYSCPNITRAIIPEGVQYIGMGAFLSCTGLKQVIIPKSAEIIEDNAFGFTESADSGEYTPVEGFKLSVYSGTAGEKYAKSSKLDYTVANKSIKKTAFIIIACGFAILAVIIAVVIMSKGRKGASAEVRKADKAAKEKAEEENYKKITD